MCCQIIIREAWGLRVKEIVKYHEVKNKEYYRPVNAPLALACADLKGMNGNNENDSVLFGAEVYAFSLEDGGITGSEIGSMSICTDQRNQGNDKKKKRSGVDRRCQGWLCR